MKEGQSGREKDRVNERRTKWRREGLR